MSISKNDLPILEYDENPISIIMPGHEDLDIKLPEKCVFPFLGDFIDEFALVNSAVEVAIFETITKTFSIYVMEYEGEQICLEQAPLGSAASAQLLDWLISYGVKRVISTGSCGVLVNIPENNFLIPKQALRDEGTSYQYLPPSRYINIDEEGLVAIEKTMDQHNLDYKEVLTWTTDGFFRETKDMVAYRVEEGCSVVEMECSALAAVSKLRGVKFGQILFTADSLADVERYDPRDWGGDSHAYALKLCFDAVIKM